MLKIKKDILLFDDGIKERLDFIVKFLNKEAVFENVSIVSIGKTNLHYVYNIEYLLRIICFYFSIMMIHFTIRL